MQMMVYATLRDILGTSKITLDLTEQTTARQLLQRLATDYPSLGDKLWDADGNLTGYVTILLNGRALEYLDGLDTPVTNADELSLFPPVGGG